MAKDLSPSSICSLSHDIQLIRMGQQDCMPGHSSGPYSCDFYLLHFVTQGFGQFHIAGKHYSLRKGELFFIPPRLSASCQADDTAPWSYLWIGLNGIMLPRLFEMAGLSLDHPVLSFSDALWDALEQVLLCAKQDGFDSLRTIGHLYLFMHQLALCGNPQKVSTPPDGVHM